MKKDFTYDELHDYAAKLEIRVKELEQRIRNGNDQADKLKARFLSNISHEIRTPMNAILGFSSLLNDHQLPGNKREEYMDLINQSSTRLIQLVEAMIDVSLLETGQLQIRNEECYINQLLTDIYHYYNIDRHRSNRNHIALLLNIAVRQDDFKIYTDQYRLHQVISNLLNNAFKYTEKGIIEFGYHLDEESEEVMFFVKDSGKGGLKDSEKIFKSFEKNEKSQNLDAGIGLGLTISKGIIELLGGKIWVEENVFHGSTFKFTIPCKTVRDMESTQLNTFSSELFIA
ncbi:MAG: HAMP domain-containing histidine kinase [Bacteroidales bacterium]|nr:HAMP domain-containing histidine kinase [Bacteroidales bacterium]